MPGSAANGLVRLKERTQHVHETGCSELEAAPYFLPRGQELGHELGCSEVWRRERIQARVTKSGEISDHLREKLLEYEDGIYTRLKGLGQ